MALPYHALNLIAPYLEGEVLSLGYPDLDITADAAEKLFGYRPTKFTEAHTWHGRKDPLPDSEELFAKLGARLTVVDFTSDRGMERIADLNEPHDLGKFDLVIDPGTLEHCFNIGQAFLNACNAVKAGGKILHLNPMTMLNHGFYNLNPTLYHDFYLQNGWEINDCSVIKSFEPKPEATRRFQMQPEYLIRVLATRHTEDELKFPIQTKYLEKMKAK